MTETLAKGTKVRVISKAFDAVPVGTEFMVDWYGNGSFDEMIDRIPFPYLMEGGYLFAREEVEVVND